MRHASTLLIVTAALIFVGGCDDPSPRPSADTTSSETSFTGDVSSTDTASCATGQTRCGDTCVDTSSDPDHCGACSTACSEDQVCSSGTCDDTCAEGLATCGSACADLQTSTSHCGACGEACASNQTCEAGACEGSPCETGQVACGDGCFDLQTSNTHCGACDNACSVDQACTAGVCEAITSPSTVCEPPISPIDTSSPDHVVGDGTPASCTHEALADAIAQGGVITFDCGDAPHTIDITSALELRIDVDTTVDGGGLIILDGGREAERQNRIFEYHSPDYRVTETLVTLQGLTLQNAEAPATDFTPQDPDNPECAWGYKDGEGGAIRMRDGRLHIIDSVFKNNAAAPQGPDTGGGAIYALGALELIVQGSSFVNNSGAGGGAIGLLQTDGLFYNSTFEGNAATGVGKNFGGATGCPEFNHAAQGGAGGNGGAIVIDGDSVERVTFCGVSFIGNSANELGTVTRTPNRQRGLTTFDHVLFDGNHAGDGGGAVWMQDMTFEMRRSAVLNNTSDGLGAGLRIDQGPHGSTLLLENTTIAGNVATDSLGGGLVFSGEGTIRNVTFARNEAAGGEGFFGAALVAHGDASQNLNIHNTIFWNNIDDHQWTPMTCSLGSPGTPVPVPGSNNVQWPRERNGSNNVEDNPCTPDILWGDAELGELADNGGPTPTMMPASGSVAIGLGADCPATDQRGEPRPGQGCAAGAVEPQ